MSLLDQIAHDAQHKHHARTSRILLTGIIENTSSSNLIQRTINDIVSRYTICQAEDEQAELTIRSLTGVTFIINNSALEMMLECETQTLIDMVSRLNSSLVQPNLVSFKILTFVECVPRSFTLYAARSIRSNQSEEWHIHNTPMNVTSLPLPPHTPSPLLTIAFSTLHSLLALAGYVKTVPQNERSEFLTSSSSRHLIDRVCPVDRIQGFNSSDELMSLSEFLDAFCAPLQIQNPRDHVWPVEQTMV